MICPNVFLAASNYCRGGRRERGIMNYELGRREKGAGRRERKS